MDILVFKTNLSDHNRIRDIEPALDVHPDIYQWNVDLNDPDMVLRVVSRHIQPKDIEAMILGAGYYCEELPD
jgi:hypothetical protein